MPQPGLLPEQAIPDGERRLRALQEGGFTPQQQLQYKQARTQALTQGGFNQEQISDYWGDKPTQSPVADAAVGSSVVQHAVSNFLGPITGAWAGLEEQQKQNWQHAFHPTAVDAMTSGLPGGGTNALRAAATLWDGLNVVFSPVVGAVNTVGAPAGAKLGELGAPAPHFTVDLKSPSSNILDPTQWTFQSDIVHGQQAGAEYGAALTGLGALAAGSKPAVRAAASARAAAVEAFRSGEIKDTSLFPQAVAHGPVSAQVQAQFPSMQDFTGAAQRMIGAPSTEALSRVTKNLQDVWASTGLTPAEQLTMAQSNPAIRQQLVAQDINGLAVTPALHDAAPPSARSSLMTSTADVAPRNGDAEALQARTHAPAFSPSVDHAMGLLAKLETGGLRDRDAAVSRTGAMGFYQIEPGTARQYGFDPARMHDHAYNENAARTIIGDLYRKFDGNMDAIAIGYNAGPGRAKQYMAAGAGTRLEAIPDRSMHGGFRYVRVQAAKNEAFLPMETQQYLAKGRAYAGGPLSALEGTGGAVVSEERTPGPGGASWKPETLPASEAEKEARAPQPETRTDTSLSAANRWDDASPEDVTKELLGNTGEQPRGELFPDYMHHDRLLSDYVSVLEPLRNVDRLLLDKDVLTDPYRDFTTEAAFRQINGADSRMSSFFRDGIVEHNNFDYKLKPNSPSVISVFKQVDKVGNRDEWVASMFGRRTAHAATRDLTNARMELAKALDAQTKAAEPFNAENFNLSDETDPAFKKQRDTKAAADARVAAAQAAFDAAVKKPGVDTGFNPFAAKRVVTDPYWRKYDDATAAYQEVKAGMLRYAVDTGRLSEKAMDSMLHSDPIHISMQRIGVDSRSAGFAKLEGSDRKVVSDPIAADMANGQWIIREADRAAAVNHLIGLAAKAPDAMAQLGLKKVEAVGEDQEAIDAALEKFGYNEDQMDEAREAFGALIQSRMDERLKPNQFARYVDGKRETWEVADPNLARALRNPEGRMQSEAIVKAAQVVGTLERTGIATGLDWSADIGLFHQLSQSQYDFLHPPPVVTLLEGLVNNFFHTDLAQRARASGSFAASIADMKGDYLEHLMTDLDERPTMKERLKDLWSNESSRPLVNPDNSIEWNTMLFPIQLSRLATELVDEGNRTGLYAQGERAKLSAAVAGARSRKTGLDYAERGFSQVGNILTQASPMYRGYLLGSKMWAEALAERPLSTAIWGASTVGLAVGLNYLLNALQDNDPSIPEALKWRNVPRYDKDRYLISPVVAGHRIRIRLPAGPAGFVFGALQQRMLESMQTHDPHSFEGLAQSFIDEHLRLPVPAVVQAPVEAVANHSFFTGHALVPASLEGNAPDRQYQPYTSQFSRNVAKLIDPGLGNIGWATAEFSPIQLDHVIQGWTGSTGMALVNALGGPARAGPPTDVSNVPGISRLWERNPGVNAQAIGDFYTEKARFDQAFSERVNARREAKGVTYAEWLSKGAMGPPPPKEAGLVDDDMRTGAIADSKFASADSRLGHVSASLGVMRDSLWSIYGSTKLDDNAKRQLVESVYAQMIKTSNGAMKEMREFEAQQHAR